jgi:hypothetical protein
MSKLIDPKKFGLHPKTVIEDIGKDHLAIVTNRKSRIIMSDGKKILEKAEKIIKDRPRTRVSLKTSAPLCSKTKAFLNENGINIL